MKVLVVLAHPSTKSFNHAIAETVTQTLKDNEHDVMFHDLYEEKFYPVLTIEEIRRGAALSPLVQRHVNDLSSADGIVVIHPSWWGQPPAILKGWIDRVFRPGVAYEFMDGEVGLAAPKGLLKVEDALVINTANTPREIVFKMFGDTLDQIWHRSIFGFCGVRNYHRNLYDQVIVSTPEQRKDWLDDVRSTVNKIFPKAKAGRMIA